MNGPMLDPFDLAELLEPARWLPGLLRALLSMVAGAVGAGLVLYAAPSLPGLQKRDPVVDTDGDGLSDQVEIALGLDPTREDTDADGLSDWIEREVTGTDPWTGDSDGDGLSDGGEWARGTSPRRADTDGDGLADGVEDATGTDPLVADSDRGGLPDGRELELGLDPMDPSDDLKPAADLVKAEAAPPPVEHHYHGGCSTAPIRAAAGPDLALGLLVLGGVLVRRRTRRAG